MGEAPHIPNEKHQAALDLIRRGLAVVALHHVLPTGTCSCGAGSECDKPGKHPRWNEHDLPNGLKNATTNEEQVRVWWRRWPKANVAVATGPGSGIWAMDVDVRHGGDERLAALVAKHGPLPRTARGRTGSGGWHDMFAWADGVPSNTGDHNRLGLGLDVRGAGGYIVAPGSVHQSGQTYEWDPDLHPDKVGFAPAPDWLLELVVVPEEERWEKGQGSDLDETAPPASFGPIIETCRFLQHCRDDAKTLGEKHWYAMLSILARVEDGDRIAHEFSSPHSGYSENATNAKLAHARAASGPFTCSYIRDKLGGAVYCNGCRHFERKSSPVTLGRPDGFGFDAPPPPDEADAPPEHARSDFGTVDDEGEQARAQNGQPWAPPIPLTKGELPVFPVEALSGWVRPFVRAVSVSLQTPVDVAGMMVLAALAAACAKVVALKVKPDWVEPVNLYVVSVLPPGERKSPLFKHITRPIYEYQKELSRELKPVIAAATNAYKILEGRLKKAQTSATNAAPGERDTHEAEAEELARQLAEKKVPAEPRLITDNATQEKLAELLQEQGGRMALMSPDTAIFDLIAGQYSNNSTPNFTVLLQAHAGDPLITDRVTRQGQYIDSPALTLGVMTQPDVIQGFSGTKVFRVRGLLGRFLYSLPKSRLGEREQDPPAIPDEVRALYHAKFHHLLRLDRDTDESGEIISKTLFLEPEARAELLRFSAELEPQLSRLGELGDMTDWAAKCVGAVARIAALLHMADYAGEPEPWLYPVEREVVVRAICIGRYCIDHALAVYGAIEANPAVDDALLILEWIRKKDLTHISRRDLFSALRGRSRFKTADDLDPAIKLLIDHTYIRRHYPEKDKKMGRPPGPAFDVNPHLHLAAEEEVREI